MGRKLITVFLIAWTLLVMPVMAFALDYDRVGSISVELKDRDGETPIQGAELSLYHVAKVSLNSEKNLSYNFTHAFEDCGFELDDPALSAKLHRNLSRMRTERLRLRICRWVCIL